MQQALLMNWNNGDLEGPTVESATKRLGDVLSIFHDREAAAKLPPDTVLYSVKYFLPIADGTEGGLFWGNTTIYPGMVGDEYYMTKGHFHRIRNRGEYYATSQGEGELLLMGEDGVTRSEPMRPGSVHYIPGNTAHRTVNTGSVPLVFVACWPSDAGHDYETIEREGFSARMLQRDGRPVLVPRSL
jgi:glucose-6-phosphate isomerase, archaeal